MKALLNKHWDKVSLGASVLIVLAYFVLGAMKAKDPIVGQVDAEIGKLKQSLEKNPPPSFDPLAYQTRVRGAFSPPAAAQAGPDWVSYRPTLVAVVVKPILILNQKEYAFKKPKLDDPKADVGVVKLSWADDPGTQNVKIAGYRLYRKKASEKEFAKIADPSDTEHSYDDATADPKTEYQYAVSAVADDKDAEAIRKLALNAKDPEGPRSDVKSVMTIGVINLTLQMASELPPEKPGDDPIRIARVTVRKFFNGWKKKDYSVKAGDRIGKEETLFEEGHAVKIDFSTNYEVLEIDRTEVTIKEKRIVKTFDPATGQPNGEKVEEIPRKVTKWRMMYKDDEGKKKELLQEDAKPTPGGSTPKPAAGAEGATPPGATPKPAAPKPAPAPKPR